MVRIDLIVNRAYISSGLTGLWLLLAAAGFVHAQPGVPFPQVTFNPVPPPKIFDRYSANPSLPPTFTISVGPLGFSVPGESYLLRHHSLVSLDFLDEDRILFTFRVSGLMQRDADDNSDDKKQQIQAMVLSLPTGKIESRAAWTVPDRSRYLWMLNDGHFLLRVPDGLDEGDAELQMKPNLRLTGRLLWIEMDPMQQVIITNSLEPATASQKPGEQSDLVARTQKRVSGEVMHVSRVPWTSQTNDWPMNSEGYLEISHDKANHWLLKLNDFSGGDRVVAHIDSTCLPKSSFVSESEFLLTTCDQDGRWRLGAMSTGGDLIWEAGTAMNATLPLLVTAPNSSLVARETLLLKRSADRYKRLIGMGDFQGQVVKVFDAANGKMLLEAPLTPILDGGGNVAISPSGQRVAILNAGAIQVFQLPALPPSSLDSH